MSNKSINAEIIAIGTEILLGELTDTNSVFLAQQLRALGINLYFMTSVGDNIGRIEQALRLAMGRAQVVITCGGLGPTVDDMTREGVARATDRELVFHEDLLAQIAERFARFNVAMTENNRRQAFLPADALKIENPVGTAPSFIVETGENVIISLPGVPREMKYLFHERIAPYLRARYDLGIIKARVLKTAGIGESALDELLGAELLEGSNPTIGLNAHSGVIDIRITAKADDEALADALIAQTEAQVQQRVGEYIFGSGSDQLEVVVARFLLENGLKLAVIQAGVGDVIAAALRGVPDGADALAETDVFPDPGAALAAFGVEGSLAEAARQIGALVCERSGAAAAIVVLSDPRVAEGADVQAATVIVAYTRQRIRERSFGFGGAAEVAQRWAMTWSLAAVWRMLQEEVAGGG